MSNLIFVDCEARGRSPVNGTMTEFGAVHETSRATFHGVLYDGTPDPSNPAIPVVGKRIDSDINMAKKFSTWLKQVCHNDRPIFVSDNVAYDWMWVAGMFDRADMDNPFGHSGRRISDYWAGLNHDFSNTQKWKTFRRTTHDHNPVNDAMGNVEAFEQIQQYAKELKENKELIIGGKVVGFAHTAVNKDMHLFIDNDHNPDICPECIQKGILVDV